MLELVLVILSGVALGLAMDLVVWRVVMGEWSSFWHRR